MSGPQNEKARCILATQQREAGSNIIIQLCEHTQLCVHTQLAIIATYIITVYYCIEWCHINIVLQLHNRTIERMYMYCSYRYVATDDRHTAQVYTMMKILFSLEGPKLCWNINLVYIGSWKTLKSCIISVQLHFSS